MSGTRWLWILVLAALLAGCGTSSKNVKTDDFASFQANYAIMRAGGDSEPSLIWQHEHFKISSYDKIYLDPIYVWRGEESRKEGVSSADLQVVADYFYTALRKKLSKNFRVVDSKNEDAIILRIAYTKIGENDTTPDILSTDTPNLDLLGNLAANVKGQPTEVGQYVVDYEIKDALSGMLILAAAERETRGQRAQQKDNPDWDDVQRSVEYQTSWIAYRMCQFKGVAGCVEPTF
jgi:hypothetical protein